MSGINKVIIIGNLGDVPDVRYTGDGVAVARFSVATTDRVKNKQSGDWDEKTEWHRLVANSPVAEQLAHSMKKGTKVYVEGKLHTRQWKTKSGSERQTTEIVVSDFLRLEDDEVQQDRQSLSEPPSVQKPERSETSTTEGLPEKGVSKPLGLDDAPF